MNRPLRRRDLLRRFQTPAEPGWRLTEQFSPHGIGRKLIKSKIAAHRRKYVCVFAQACVFESLLRKLSAHLIQRARIDLTKPAFVFPRTSANINAPLRQRLQAVAEPVAIEREWLIQIEKRIQFASPGLHLAVIPGVGARLENSCRRQSDQHWRGHRYRCGIASPLYARGLSIPPSPAAQFAHRAANLRGFIACVIKAGYEMPGSGT